MLIQQDHGRKLRFYVSGILFIIIALMVWKSTLLPSTVEAALQTLFTSNHASGFMTFIMKFISFIGSPKMTILWTLVIAFLLWGFKFKVPAVWSVVTLFGADVLGWIVKHIIQRARPSQHLASDDGYSFPSGHVLGTFIVAAIILLILVPLIQNRLKRNLTIALTLIFVILLAISRVYLYAHYPTDTIGAMLLAYTWVQVMEMAYVKYAPTLQHWNFTHNSQI